MLRTIISKELKELRRDKRFKIASLIVMILLLLAGFTTFNQYKTTAKQYETSETKEREIWDTQKNKNPHSAAHDGTYVFKPRNVMSLLDNGINSYTGNVVFLEAHSRNKAAYGDAYDETEFARNNKLTLNFVLLYMFPLLILLVGFNIISKEKEMDTLRLLKSQGVKPFQLVLGKWFAIFTIVFCASAVLFIIIGFSFSMLDLTGSFSWLDLMAVFVSYLWYYAIIITITVLISTVSKTSGIALVSNLSIWVLFCFIMPKIATNVANSLYPFPTKQEFISTIKKDQDENGFNAHDPNNKKGIAFKDSIFKVYKVKSLKDLDFNYGALLMQRGEEDASAIYAKHYNKLDKIAKDQQATYQTLAFLTPFVPTRLLSMDISKAGYKEDARFANEADKYRLVVQKFLNDDLKNSKLGDRNYTMDDDKFKDLPKFSFTSSSLSNVLKWNVSNMLILLAWLFIPFVLLFQSSKKI